MNTQDAKIETLADYVANSKSDIEWCKKNLKAAKDNKYLPKNYSKKIKEKLYKGIQIRNIETNGTTYRRFDYPLQYIRNVMNPGINQWNKWVILLALEFYEEEFEDIYKLSINSEEKVIKRKNKLKKVSPLEHLIKRHKLRPPIALKQSSVN